MPPRLKFSRHFIKPAKLFYKKPTYVIFVRVNLDKGIEQFISDEIGLEWIGHSYRNDYFGLFKVFFEFISKTDYDWLGLEKNCQKGILFKNRMRTLFAQLDFGEDMNHPNYRLYSQDFSLFIRGLDSLFKNVSASRAFQETITYIEKEQKWAIAKNKLAWSPSLDSGNAFSETIESFNTFLLHGLEFSELFKEAKAKNSKGGNTEEIRAKRAGYHLAEFFVFSIEEAISENRARDTLSIEVPLKFIEQSEETDFTNKIYFLISEVIRFKLNQKISLYSLKEATKNETAKNTSALYNRIKAIDKKFK